MIEAVAGDGWFRKNSGLKVVEFEGEDEEGCCVDVLDDKVSGRHVQRWWWILPEIYACCRYPGAEVDPHGGGAEGLLPEVVGKVR